MRARNVVTASILLTCFAGATQMACGSAKADTGVTAQPGSFSTLSATAHLTGSSYASNVSVKTTAVGSGVNGPSTAQVGLTVNAQKDNWFSGPAAVGELDGIYVVTRQGGAGSDSSGLLVDVQNTGLGFLSATEMVSNIVDPTTNTLVYGIDLQDGVLNNVTGDRYGRVFNADHGTLKAAMLVQNGEGASWGSVLLNSKDGVENFSIDDDGNLSAAQVTSRGSIQLGTYSYASLPTAGSPGRMVLCTDCRKPSETAGAGTGMTVFDDGHGWVSTAGTVASH